MKAIQVRLNIPVSHFHSVLSWDDRTIGELVDKAIYLAVKIGLRLDDDEQGVYLREAESKGAQVDWNERTVMFRDADIQETMEVMRRTSPAPKPLRQLCASEQGRETRFMVGNGANLLFDWDAWQVKAPAVSDMIDLCHWAQGCEDIEELNQPVMLKDIDPLLEPIYSYALMCKYCRKAVYHNQPTAPIHAKYLHRMSRVVEKYRHISQPMQAFEFVNPPFRMASRSVATMLERVDSGACTEMGIGTMSVAGMSAPVTVVGLAVTALAEILTGLTLFRILRPGYGLLATACTGSLDLRNAGVSYFGMHAHLCNLAAWELLVRGLGADATCLTWYRDANEPGMQALYEYGIAQAFFSSLLYRCYPEIGGLACGNIFSPHQAVMDFEAIKEFNELLAGFRAGEEELGIEEIVNARFEQGVHMASDHTLKHMENGVPFSRFLFRGLPGGAQHDKHHTQTDQLMDKAAQAVDDAKRMGREVEPDEELAGELYEYVREAAAELEIEIPPLV